MTQPKTTRASRTGHPPKAGMTSLRAVRIEAVSPVVDGGRHPAKCVAGEPCAVEADIFRDGHSILRAAVLWKRRSGRQFSEVPLRLGDNDRWRGEIPISAPGRWVFTVEAWTDRYASWLRDLGKKVAVDEDVSSDLLEGAVIVEAASHHAKGADRKALITFAEELGRPAASQVALGVARGEVLNALMERYQARADAVRHEQLFELWADRPRARFSAWYEMFPRSQGRVPGRASTFRDAEERLRDISDMGFDVVYLPPIHPIGRTNRKGRGNALRAQPGEPGSPWAIGSADGGHMAVEPALGSLDDFDHFVQAAAGLGLEIALDFAIQCSPDHPWVKEHPEWFQHRPDGTIKYAENPPKKYQDIYPINFETEDLSGLTAELRDVLLFWIGHGVKIFRVDNPHTKAIPFWEWLIDQIHEAHPEVIFLAEAFTRPKMMKALAKVGFTQSYTYFTWRNSKWELESYLRELTETDMRDYYRPNFFANTPDILHEFLQTGGRPAFRLRLVLASTLSPSYGIYSGYELCEADAVPGTEEYRGSEKYEIRVRDWDAPGNIKELVARLNRIRRENPALQELTNLRFLNVDEDNLISYAKATADRSNVIIVAVNLDPFHPHHGTVWVPPDAVGVEPGEKYEVLDLLTGAIWQWSESNYVRLDPAVEPAHVLKVRRIAR